MSGWEDNTQAFRNEVLDKILKDKNLVRLADGDRARVYEFINDITAIEEASRIEPYLKYNCGLITPSEYIGVLIDQLRDDVYPLLNSPEVTAGGAPFTVLRNIFCYIDLVSMLRYGPDKNSSYGKGTGNISKLLMSFGPKDMKARYRKYSKYLIQIYRHDLVHTVEPRLKIMKIISNNTNIIQLIGWSIRSDCMNKQKYKSIIYNFDIGAKLMRSDSFRKNEFLHLRFDENSMSPVINTIAFFFDLVNYLFDYQNSLTKDEDINKEFALNYVQMVAYSSLTLLKYSLEIKN